MVEVDQAIRRSPATSRRWRRRLPLLDVRSAPIVRSIWLILSPSRMTTRWTPRTSKPSPRWRDGQPRHNAIADSLPGQADSRVLLERPGFGQGSREARRLLARQRPLSSFVPVVEAVGQAPHRASPGPRRPCSDARGSSPPSRYAHQVGSVSCECRWVTSSAASLRSPLELRGSLRTRRAMARSIHFDLDGDAVPESGEARQRNAATVREPRRPPPWFLLTANCCPVPLSLGGQRHSRASLHCPIRPAARRAVHSTLPRVESRCSPSPRARHYRARGWASSSMSATERCFTPCSRSRSFALRLILRARYPR